MKEELTEQQTREILNAFDEALKNGPWEESNFLRVIGKSLREIRDNFASHLNGDEEIVKGDSSSVNPLAQRSDHRAIYVSLYSSEGNNLQAWERILANLPRQMISRPVYENEVSVQHLIKSKENKVNEAYVVIYINHADILPVPPDKILTDKFGNPLMNLKDRSLRLENIVQFVHLSGTYRYVKGRLIKNTS
ncbi:Dot/Icm secretion system protein IcmQ [Legionella fairfieldensis]|uniref:IcmQ n=1 Tax=Legionella fairfieldensis TaxID=45064 RepID=Q49J75_9GAMM|nr:Dot/Icm secretion system protein IcmQ [Legionella fairfieldensis]AAX56201.1 IcmQ [Legionella fairfieldensis]